MGSANGQKENDKKLMENEFVICRKYYFEFDNFVIDLSKMVKLQCVFTYLK